MRVLRTNAPPAQIKASVSAACHNQTGVDRRGLTFWMVHTIRFQMLRTENMSQVLFHLVCSLFMSVHDDNGLKAGSNSHQV